jgi:hypothetical protein
MLELLTAAGLTLAGAVVLILWADARAGLDGRSLVALAWVICLTTAGAGLALRTTALTFEMGAVPSVVLGLAGWAVVIGLIARAPVQPVHHVPDDDLG